MTAPTHALLVVAASAIAVPASAESIRFTKQPGRVGDRLEQRIEASMDLELRSTRGAEVLETRRSETGRRQHREVVAASVEAGVVTSAAAHFYESVRVSEGQEEVEPVVGKTYHCTREGDTLRITTVEGLTPSLAEFQVVSRAMASLGKPNPLADYLSGRSVTVGERLVLPPEVASGLMGLEEKVNEVERFELTLRSVAPGPVALFSAEVEATGAGSSQMRTLLAGEMRVEASTCRVLSTRLTGPVGLMETRGGIGNSWRVSGTGQVSVAVESVYAAADARLTSSPR